MRRCLPLLMALALLGACREERVLLGEGSGTGDPACTHPVFCTPDLAWAFEERDGTAEPALGRSGEPTATRFGVNAAGGYARWVRKVTPPLAEGELHLAAQLRVAGGFALSDWVVVIEAKGSEGKVSLDLAAADSWQLFTDTSSTSSADPPVARDTWTCATLSMTIAAEGRAGASVESGTKLQVEPADTLLTGGISGIYFGLTSSAVQNDPSEIVVDELRVSDLPLACP